MVPSVVVVVVAATRSSLRGLAGESGVGSCMYTPPLWYTGVNILVRLKSHGLFPSNGCILELLILVVGYHGQDDVLVLFSEVDVDVISRGEKSKLTHTREFRPTIHLPSPIG